MEKNSWAKKLGINSYPIINYFIECSYKTLDWILRRNRSIRKQIGSLKSCLIFIYFLKIRTEKNIHLNETLKTYEHLETLLNE